MFLVLRRSSALRTSCTASLSLLKPSCPVLEPPPFEEASIPLDVPRGRQHTVQDEGGWYDQARKVWMTAPDNTALVKKYGVHLRVYLDPVGEEASEVGPLGAHWSALHMRWYTIPADPNHQELVARFYRERVIVDVPFEQQKDALEAGLKWCPNSRVFFCLSDDPHKDGLFAKFHGKRIYFKVPPGCREDARELGCQYDPVNCGWYTVSGSDKLHLVRDRFDETPRPSVKRETQQWPRRAPASAQ